MKTVVTEPSVAAPIGRQRWQEAQSWERAFWDRQNVPPPLWKRALRPALVWLGLRPPLERTQSEGDDRNHWWARQFDGYSMLPSEIDGLCELGCGPYTNTRLLLRGRSARRICCSDPLAPRYLTYERAWLARAWRERAVAVACHAAEHCPYPSDAFEVTALVNVLDHVFDPRRCVAEAIRITRPNGLVVFGQDLTGCEDRQPSNPGHPFTLSLEQLQPWLAGLEAVYSRVVPRSEMHEPEMHQGAWAFVGRKPGSLPATGEQVG